ncbi:MAG: hypothetical protein M3P34_03065, partial [Actinomycetota bacterium]|nr:hypothetical protein [Actinomycetota bacterium]
MRSFRQLAISTVCAAAVTLFPAAAAADHDTRPHTKNIHAMGHSAHPASFADPAAVRHINSDLAFWGKLAFNGNYDGFRVVDISAPGNPVELTHQRCNGDQGDLVVWANVLVRAWNSPAPAGRFCDGVAAPSGFEGVHVFDVSNPADPVLVAAVPLECGSHTVTAAGVVDGNLVV